MSYEILSSSYQCAINETQFFFCWCIYELISPKWLIIKWNRGVILFKPIQKKTHCVTQLSDHYTILEERIKYKAIRHDPTDDVPIIHIISFFMWTFYKFSYYYVSPLIEKDMDENYTYNFFIIFRYFSFRLEIIVFFFDFSWDV